jgi:6-pyruvoyltetrahydropterin/6-carboxytetrahydropterin synthase
MNGERLVELTRRYRFEAAHRLHTTLLSEDENQRVFGKCCRPGGHGHNYEVELTLRGRPDGMSGFLMSRQRMDALVEEHLLARVDHRNLNDVIDDVVTTGENLARRFHEWLRPVFDRPAELVRVRVRETPKNLFEYPGGGTEWKN